MFRLHKSRHCPLKPGEKSNFKFSHFEAFQVPKRWDKLFVFIISVETGKTVAKTSKAVVRNGSCQWTDSVSDSIWIPAEEDQSRCPYKLVLSMGSARSGILGEAVVNMATYVSSSDIFPVSIPLNKCTDGTILQFEIQCLNPRIMDDGRKLTKKDHNVDSKEAVIESGDSHKTPAKSTDSYNSSKDFSSNSHEEDDEKEEVKGTQEESSARSSDSLHSCNSTESSIEREDSNGIEHKQIDFSSLQNSVISGSSKTLLEVAEATIEDLRREAKHWERNAIKSMLDLEILTKRYTEQSKSQANLGMELSATSIERDCLQKEVDHLNELLQKSSEMENRATRDNSNVVKEMENEIKFLKEQNDVLTQQLCRTQVSHAELVLMLQELEEKKKPEIDDNRDLILQARQFQEPEKNFRAVVQVLEKELKEETENISDSESLKDQYHECQMDQLEEEMMKEEIDHRLQVLILRRKIAEMNEEMSGKENMIGYLRTSWVKLEEQKLEYSKCDFEVLLSELKQENDELSGCVTILEDQIQNLTDDRKSIALELHNSRSNSVILQDEIARLRSEMKSQETEARQKLDRMREQWQETQEELENLRNENPKLQATAECLIKNCGSLQNSVRKLRMQNLELQEHCDSLEMKLSEAQRNFSECSKRVNVLQENICSLVEESTAKERGLTGELDALVKENDSQNKKIIVLDQMHREKSDEAENLRLKLEELDGQLCLIRDEKERLALDSEKEGLDLREKISKLEMELKTLQTRSRVNIEDLMDELASSKQNQEILKTEMAKMSNSLENYRSSEENFKTTVNNLESKLKVFEQEHGQLTEETTKLKDRLAKLDSLEGEVVILRNEKQKLEASLNEKSEECKELEMEKSLCSEKLTELRKNFSELEDCRNDKFVLEERIQQLESSLIANEALSEQDTELRKELNWMKISNQQLQQQIQQLQEEKQKLKENQRKLKESSNFSSPGYHYRREGDKPKDEEFFKSNESSNVYKVELKRLTSENIRSTARYAKNLNGEVEFVGKEKFERTKSSLEAELRELREKYLDLSLKYAQGEAQREELVMKLRANNNGKRFHFDEE